VLVDLRGHGDSTLATASDAPVPPHTVAACADDLLALERRLGVTFTKAFGHSFGGKVVLELASRSPSVGEVWFLDTPLGPTADPSASRDEIARVLDALRSLGDRLPGRVEVAAALKVKGLSDALAQWMTTNVRGTAAEGYRWKLDLDMVEALIADYFVRDCAPFVRDTLAAATPDARVVCRVRGVRGGLSDRFGPAEIAELEAIADLRVDVLPNAGHWLHVDDADGLRALLASALTAHA
jgi:pimeloyl-ACP methyl ester carboxylesterase